MAGQGRTVKFNMAVVIHEYVDITHVIAHCHPYSRHSLFDGMAVRDQPPNDRANDCVKSTTPGKSLAKPGGFSDNNQDASDVLDPISISPRPMKPTTTSTTTYHLEMRDPKAFIPKAPPSDFEVAIVAPPNPELNRQFYREVGSQWEWTDRLTWTTDDWRSYVQRDSLKTWVGTLHGQSIGYFELELQEGGNIEIVYFGVLPEFIGRGLGGTFLSAAVQSAWDTPGTQRVWVHTCTLDHVHALDNYRKRGFEIFKTEQS